MSLPTEQNVTAAQIKQQMDNLTKLASMGCVDCAKNAIPVAPDSSTDLVCRRCGAKLLVKCSQCAKAIRPDDKVCVHCGKRRFMFLEAMKNEKETLLTIGAVISVAAAIGAVAFFVVRQRGHK